MEAQLSLDKTKPRNNRKFVSNAVDLLDGIGLLYGPNISLLRAHGAVGFAKFLKNAASLLDDPNFSLDDLDQNGKPKPNTLWFFERVLTILKGERFDNLTNESLHEPLTNEEEFFGRITINTLRHVSSSSETISEADGLFRLFVWLSLDAYKSSKFPVSAHYHVAAKALASVDPTLKENEQAQSILGHAFHQHTRAFCLQVSGPTPEKTWARDGMLALDAEFADFLEGLNGKTAKAWAEKVRTSSRKRWASYLENSDIFSVWELWIRFCPDEAGEPDDIVSDFGPILAGVLWHDRVKSLWEGINRQVAAPMSTTREIFSLIMGANLDGNSLTNGRQMLARIEPSDHLKKKAQPEVPAQLFSLIHKNMRTMAANRLIKHGWQAAHQQRALEVANPNLIRTVGGWRQLTENLGMTPGKQSHEVEQATRALDALVPLTGILGGRGRIIAIMTDISAAPGRKAIVDIQVNDLLTYQSVHGLEGADRKLVPIPHKEPPLYGRRNGHAAQLWLQMEVMAIFRDRAVELLRNNAVIFDRNTHEVLAHKFGLDLSTLQKIIDHWVAGSETEVPFLSRTDRNALNLSDYFSQERGMILEAGQIIEAGAKGGRKTQANRGVRIFGRGAR